MWVSAVQVDIRPLLRLKQMFGGNVTRLGTTKKGSEIWQWRVGNAAEIRDVVPKLLPYLFLKRREAEIVFEFAHTVRPRGRVPNGVEAHPSAMVAKRWALIEELGAIRGRSAAEEVMLG